MQVTAASPDIPEGWDSDLSTGSVVTTTFTADAGAEAVYSVTTHATGKWYAEVTFTSMGDGLAGEVYVGIANYGLSLGNIWAEDAGIVAFPFTTITGSRPGLYGRQCYFHCRRLRRQQVLGAEERRYVATRHPAVRHCVGDQGDQPVFMSLRRFPMAASWNWMR